MAALRRDRLLFAVTGAMILFASYFQPLAEANAAGTAHSWIVCTEFGAARTGPQEPGRDVLPGADDCPKCVAGACQPFSPVKAIAGPAAAVDVAIPDGDVAPRFVSGEALRSGPPSGTRGIRAPPLSA